MFLVLALCLGSFSPRRAWEKAGDEGKTYTRNFLNQHLSRFTTMSKASGGKVYFILYLAVILELLIIIVERDEAEDHLRKREREAREIIQDILGQMQVGPGNENLTSRITDEISLVSDEAIQISGIPYKRYRTYNVEVGVNDGSGVNIGESREDTLAHNALLRRLTNAQQLNYEILHTPHEDVDLPTDSTPAAVVTSAWRSMGKMSLRLDSARMRDWKQPAYREEYESGSTEAFFKSLAPLEGAGLPVFTYNAAETDKIASTNAGKYLKRLFTVNFQPTEPGWYKLRFNSRTNRIMGVSGSATTFDEVSDDAKVNIGSMQLTVKKLRKVQVMLQRELESFGVPPMDEFIAANSEDKIQAFFRRIQEAKQTFERGHKDEPTLVQETLRKIDLYLDVAKLLAPNKSEYFAQNSGVMEINIRVTKPPVAIVKPHVDLPKDVYVFDKLVPTFNFSAGPYYGNNVPSGVIVAQDGSTTPLIINAVNQVASTNPDDALLEKGKSIEFRAHTVQALKHGVYTVRMTHSAGGGTAGNEEITEESALRVFATQLTPNNRRLLDGRMKSIFYGSTFSVTLEPDTGGMIPASEFRTTVGLNTSQSPAPVSGLTAKIPLEAKAKSAWTRLTWISPFTGEEVEILPRTEQPIKQREPDVDVTKSAVMNLDGDWHELRLQVGGIVLTPAVIDVGSKIGGYETLTDVRLTDVTLEGATDIELTQSDLKSADNGSYVAVFTVRSMLPKVPKEMSGSIKFSVNASMRNPNGVRSNTASYEAVVPFMYAPPQGKGKRGN
jgi:hypothetical protein